MINFNLKTIRSKLWNTENVIGTIIIVCNAKDTEKKETILY